MTLHSLLHRLRNSRIGAAWFDRPLMVLTLPARDAVRQAAAAAPPVAVADLVAAQDARGHAARAEAYFCQPRDLEALFRRPFHSAEDARTRLPGVATMLQLLDLAPGMRVLDFGCGTGWLSQALGSMGADVTGVDVSDTALTLARGWLAQDRLADRLAVRFTRYDGLRLPLADASMDRVVCFDALHHVPDIAATLAELARILTMDGVAVFHEPGPEHASTPDAQHEMRRYGVIENNIDIRQIWAQAKDAGFGHIRMTLPALQAPIVTIDAFERVVAGRPSRRDSRVILQNTLNYNFNLRVFALHRRAAR